MHVNRITSVRIFLFLCLVLPLTGNYLLLLQKKEMFRKEMRANLRQGKLNNELLLLKFEGKEKQVILDSNEEGEFEHKGIMYDIVETNERNDTLYCWCWPDHKETIINSKLCDFMNTDFENEDEDDERKKEMSNLFKKIYFHGISLKKIICSSDRIYNSCSSTCTVAFPGTPPFLPPERS